MHAPLKLSLLQLNFVSLVANESTACHAVAEQYSSFALSAVGYCSRNRSTPACQVNQSAVMHSARQVMSTAMQAGNVEGLPMPCMQRHHARETPLDSIHKYTRHLPGHPAEQMLSVTLPHIRFQGDQAHQKLPNIHNECLESSKHPPAAAAWLRG